METYQKSYLLSYLVTLAISLLVISQKKMALPVEKLVIVINENDILHRFLKTGVYERYDKVLLTLLPTIDVI